MASVSDNFDSYTNAAYLEDQTNWDLSLNAGGLWISKPAADGRVAVSNATRSCCYYVGTFANDQWAQATFLGAAAADSSIGVAVRVSSNNYYCWESSNFSSYLSKITSGSGVDFATGAAWTANDVVKLEIVGNELRCYRNGSLDTSVSTDGKYTDASSPFTSGNPGISKDGSNAALVDSWSSDTGASTYEGILYVWSGSAWIPRPLDVQNGGMVARPVWYSDDGATWKLAQSF